MGKFVLFDYLNNTSFAFSQWDFLLVNIVGLDVIKFITSSLDPMMILSGDPSPTDIPNMTEKPLENLSSGDFATLKTEEQYVSYF